jgi:predicted  nucleic acid-binding Zn-ribbon protein
LEENKQKQIERHAKVLESLIKEVHELKVQRERIEKGDDPTEVRTWSRDLEQTVLQFENVISEVKQQREKLRKRTPES